MQKDFRMSRRRPREAEKEEEDATYPVVAVEAAKSGRSKCSLCRQLIANGTLRVQIVDDVLFQALGGMARTTSAPYFELPNQTVSVERKWAHLSCYDPYEAPRPHPPKRAYFRLAGNGKGARSELDAYLQRFWPVSLESLRTVACIWTFRRDHPFSQLPRDVRALLLEYLLPHPPARMQQALDRAARRKRELLATVGDWNPGD